MEPITKQEADGFANQYGYSAYMRSGCGTQLTYNKDFETFFLSLTINTVKRTMVLQGFPGMFTLSTGELSFGHKRFTQMFECRMVEMMDAITDLKK